MSYTGFSHIYYLQPFSSESEQHSRFAMQDSVYIFPSAMTPQILSRYRARAF